MRIASAASAFPKHYYSQKFLLEELQEYWGDQPRNPQLLARLHRNVAVGGRHLAIPPEKYYELTTWAGLEPSELGALFFTSVTGMPWARDFVPSLYSYSGEVGSC